MADFVNLSPFGLSLSKPVLSGCRRQAAEGAFPVFRPFKEVMGFDRLSPNGSVSRCGLFR